MGMTKVQKIRQTSIRKQNEHCTKKHKKEMELKAEGV